MTQNTDIGSFLHNVNTAINASGTAAYQFGAQVVVMNKFLHAVLPQLTAAQCVVVVQQFRSGIEHAMSLTDDVAMPASYHASLLQHTNQLLDALNAKISAGGPA